MAAIVLGVAFIAGTPIIPLGLTAGAASLFGLVFIMSAPYRRERWLAFLNLAQHKQDAGFQVWQSLIGVASGGLVEQIAQLGATFFDWDLYRKAIPDLLKTGLPNTVILAVTSGVIGTVAGMLLVNFLGGYAVVPAILKHHNTYCSYADTIMPQFFFAVGFAYRLTFLRRRESSGAWAAISFTNCRTAIRW